MTDTDPTTGSDEQAVLRDRIVDYIAEHGPTNKPRGVTFGEIGDALGVNRQLARVRLREAFAAGRVERAGTHRGHTLWLAADQDAMNQPVQGRVDGVTATAPPPEDTTPAPAPPDLDDVEDTSDRDDLVRAEIAKHSDGVTTSAVADALGTESQQVYNSIRRLRDAGAVEKRQDPDDKRTVLWTVTGA